MTGDLERIRAALAFVPADDRGLWVRMGMAIKSEAGDAGFEVWDTWSQGASAYRETDARDVWKSIKGNGAVTAGTLYHEARGHGWRDDSDRLKPTLGELADRLRLAEERAARDQAEIAREREDCASKAAAAWRVASPALSDHPYLTRKGVTPGGTLREIEAGAAAAIFGYAPQSSGEPLAGRLLVVPVKVGERLSTLELIDGDGRKTALKGRGTKAGGYWAAQPMPEGDGTGLVLLIGEGVATGLSAKAATGHPAIAALADSNLPAVARAMRDRYPGGRLVLLADLVKATGEPDRYATEAAQAVGGSLAVPDFGPDRPEGATDFNDLVQARGLEAVARAVAGALAPAGTEPQPDPEGAPEPAGVAWPDPQPLTAKVAPEPYPVDALPPVIRAAIGEVAGFVKAPLPLVASSALAALSLACQGHIDVKRAEKLQGPTGLFLLTIADSGERKTTCDGFFTSAIRQWETEQADAMRPELERSKAAMDAWTAERDGLLSAIKATSAKGKDTGQIKADLARLQGEKPKAVRAPRLLLGDETPENLAWILSQNWPSAGVVSSEAGLIFGAHGMGKDSVMRNLALLNVLWDGGTHSVGRRTSESFTVRGARLTVGLQIQEAALRDFFDRSGGLARGSGFLARFLAAWPESTQGYRPFTEAPDNWPHLARFHARIAAILADPVPMDDDGALEPVLMTLAPAAKAAWVAFHDAIERELVSGGELYDVRDVASKTADNAVRLAALFQVFEGGVGAVGADIFEGASRVAAWHLSEARRFFGELALPAELADAARLDAWLIDYCRRERTHEVPKNHTRQCGPLRDGKRLDTALRELADLDRVRLFRDGRRQTLKVSPSLLEVAP